MSFKDQIALDLAVFFNIEENADSHNINGQNMPVVLDGDTLRRRQAKGEYGYEGTMVIFVAQSDYGEEPAIGEILNLDGEIYRVTDVQSDQGVYSITIEANMS